MTRASCGKCRFCEDNRCRINPPQLPHFMDDEDGGGPGPEDGIWPFVFDDEWCGHFSSRLDPVES